MAINKNFVIKNGLEVNTNVLVAASEESQVGVGTTRPYYKLHVGGGEGNRGGIGATDITITGIATIGVANSDSGAFNVLGISTFKGDIDLIGSAGISTVRWDASKDGLIFQDNATARFGTGEDLRIWHDGSNSYISDQGTGSLIIYGTDETLAVFTDDGSVQLYNNDSKKLETTGLGITVYGDSIVSGVTTTARLNVTGIATVGTALSMNDNVKAQLGTGGDLTIWHDGSNSFIKNITNDLTIQSGSISINDVANGKTSASFDTDGAALLFYDNTERLSTTAIGATVFGDFITSGVGTFGKLYVTGISTFANTVNVSTGATITTAGNAAFAGIVTANGGVNVGTAVTIDAETGNVAISGITTIGGNLYVTGDITYDEVTGRNLNISGFSTFANDVLFDNSANANKDILWDQSANKLEFSDGVKAIFGNGEDLQIYHTGSQSHILDQGTGGIIINSDVTSIKNSSDDEMIARFTQNAGVDLFFDDTERLRTAAGGIVVTGIATADRFIGIHTSADGGGVGIGSTTAHVGYGITYIDFKGPGVSTVYYSSVTGVSTVYFQGGGSSVGAAGTWQNDGAPGISTAKSVGVNTNSINDGDLQGRPYVGAAGSFQGLYIGNGMVVNDNQLNGDHYIGTAFGGMMVGPVTINGVLTIDGNYAVV